MTERYQAFVMQGKDAVLIYNPNSGRGKAATLATDFFQHWEDRTGTRLRLRPTRSLADIRVAAAEIQEHELPIFMGGDGTLSESLQGLAETASFAPLSRPIGFLPGGTGNSFLRDFGITGYASARDALLGAIAGNQSLGVDVGMIEYSRVSPNAKAADDEAPSGDQTVRRLSMNIFAVGLISDITALAIRMRALGSFNYTLASLIKLLFHRPYRYHLRVDGKSRDVDCNLVCVSNSRFTGGAMEIAPEVRVNDGRLFWLCPQIKGRLAAFGLFPSIFKGTHINHPQIETDFIRQLTIECETALLMNIDGELESGWNPTISVQPGYFQLYMDPERLQHRTGRTDNQPLICE